MSFQYQLLDVQIDGDKPEFNPEKTQCTISLKITAEIVNEQNGFTKTAYNQPMTIPTTLTVLEVLQAAQTFAQNYISTIWPNT